MTKILRVLFIMSLTLLFLVTSIPSLSADTPATVPLALQPSVSDETHFFCTNRAGAELIDIQAKENADCHAQIAKGTSGLDGSTIIIGGIVVFLLGLVVGKTL